MIGFMGSGKSSCGRELANRSGLFLIDTDAEIVRHAGMSVSDIFATRGEEAFRQLETETLQELLKRNEDMIVSVGGGTPLREENRKLLKQMGKVFYLKASPENVYERVKENTARPLLQGPDPMGRIRQLMKDREEIYPLAADHIIETDGLSVDEVCDQIEKLFWIG